jgi:hypothetical protein
VNVRNQFVSVVARGRDACCRFESLEQRTLLAGDVVLEWNALANEAVKLDHGIGAPHLNGGPTATSRALAIVQGAVYDAVNAIDRSYAPWLVTDVKPQKGSSIEAAAAQAAHDALVGLYPYLQSMFDSALAADLNAIGPAPRARGAAVGSAVASEILAARAHDGSDLPMNYTFGDQPGEWRADPLHPTQEALGPDWGKVQPFGMLSNTQFQVPPPPAITSPEYAAAYNEVKAIGGDGITTTSTRTAEQTQIGFFWGYDGTPGLGTPPRLYNQIAEVIAKQQRNTEIENARFFALINFAMADAGIACWNDKYTYQYWRPITGIRENDPGTGPTGLGSGNPLLVDQGDPTWTPLGAPNDNGGGTNFTPPFPSYASGHATFGGALFKTMADYYGKDNIHFSFVSDEFNGITKDQYGVTRPVVSRSFKSLSQAMEENGQSRIYLGIHWSFDKVHGINCGKNIADYNFAHMLRPVYSASSAAVASRTFVASEPTASTTNSTDVLGDQTTWVL